MHRCTRIHYTASHIFANETEIHMSFLAIEQAFKYVEYTRPRLTSSLVNPLCPNDPYLRQIIESAQVPMTHICVKDEGAHFKTVLPLLQVLVYTRVASLSGQA